MEYRQNFCAVVWSKPPKLLKNKLPILMHIVDPGTIGKPAVFFNGFKRKQGIVRPHKRAGQSLDDSSFIT